MDRLKHSLKVSLLLLCTAVIIVAAVLMWKPSGVSAESTQAQRIPACAAQPQGLTAWWRFEGNSIDHLNGTSMLLTEGVTFVDGHVGTATNFPNATAYGAIPGTATQLNPGTGDFSMAAWIRYTGNGVHTILDNRPEEGRNGYTFYMYNGRPGVQLATSTYNNFNPNSGPTFNDGEWHFIVATIDRDNPEGLKLYGDGQLVATFNPTAYTSSIANNASARVGLNIHGNLALTGSLDELDYYNRLITPGQIQEVYAAGAAGKCVSTTPPTSTPLPPTSTSVPPTSTPVLPTETPTTIPTIIPTVTATPIPPTTVPPTVTPTSPPVSGDYRDIGVVRIWASSFVDGSTVTASGNVVIGNATTNQPYFKISGTASWSLSGGISISGALKTYGDNTARSVASLDGGSTALGAGNFTINRDTGAVTWAPTNQVLYTNLGNSQLAITPTITVNVLNPEVSATSQVHVSLPEQQSISGSINFSIGQHGQVTANSTLQLDLKLAGGTLTGTLGAHDDGLTASNVQYTLPTIGSITLYNLVIDGKGPAKLHFGGSATFPIPDLNLGNNILVLSNLQGTVGLTYTNTTGTSELSYLIEMSGTLRLPQLPKNGNAEVQGFNLGIANGSIYGEVRDLKLNIAGKKLSLPKAKFGKRPVVGRFGLLEGFRYELVAEWASYDLPSSWTGSAQAAVQLRDVVVMTEAPYIQIGGAGASFSTTEAFYLGGNANSAVSIKFDQLSGAFRYNLDARTWSTALTSTVTFKFGNESAILSNVNLVIDEAGVTTGSVANVTLKIGGVQLVIAELTYEENKWTAASARLTLPASWGVDAGISVSNIRITNNGITIGGAGGNFSTTQAFYLGGDASSKASVKFDQLSGSFQYSSSARTWSVQLSARITFTFGTDSTVVNGVTLTVNNGQFSAAIASVTLKVAGLQLYVGQLNYADNVFTAGTISLKLPQSWGGSNVSVSGLHISKDGVRIGGLSGTFGIPDQNIAGVLRLSGMTGTVSIDNQRNYAIQLNGTITIQKVSSAGNANGATITGSLKIANGRVSGTINSFSFKLVGVEFGVTNAQFVDNKITAQTVSLKLPSNLGGASASVSGLEIGGADGFKISGGSFRLPDFTMGGVGVQNVFAEIVRESSGNYAIAAGAKLNFVQFSIEGRFKVAYNTSTNKVALREVYVAFEGRIPTTALPLGTTGFYLTKVWGQFNLEENDLRIAFGVRAAMAFQIGGKPLVGLEGSVAVRIKPSFEFTSSANASLLGYEIASVDLRITKTSFSLEAELHAGIIHAALEIAFGKDTANEFTFYGKAKISLVVPRGTFVNKRWLKIPRKDWSLGYVQLDAGKFRHKGSKVWGGRLSGKLLGFSYFVFAKFSPGLGIDVGTRMSEYEPIRPAYRPEITGLKPTDEVFEVDVAYPTTELTIAEGITDTNQATPQELVVLSPNGVPFTQELIYIEDDNSQRIYTITLADPAQAVGKWTIIIQDGNEIAVFGVIPGPQVDTFTVCTTSNVCLENLENDTTVTPVTLEVGETVDVTWATSHISTGLTVDIYAEGSDGSVHVLANDYTETGTSLSGATSWTPLVPAGLYTITLRLEDQLNASTVVTKMPLNIVDTTAPGALVGLTAIARTDGSVQLTWDTTQVAADVLGYRFAVDGQPAISVEDTLTSYDLYGLQPGVVHEIAVTVYDHSGNESMPATTTVLLDGLTVSAQWPTRDFSATLIDEVMVTFNRPVTLMSFVVEAADGTPVVGTTTPITQEYSVGEVVVIGAEFAAADGFLPLGSYTARVQVVDVETGTPLTVEWPFEVVAPAIRVYLPTLQR